MAGEEAAIEDAIDEQTEELDQGILDMSDEDFAKTLMGDFSEPNTNLDATEEASEEEASSEASEEDEVEEETEEDSSEEEETDSIEEENEDDDDDDAEEDSDSETEEDKKEEEELSPEQLVEQIFSPFRANGKDMQASSVEDVRQLMQMGANYNKKMAALKPNLKLMKMLDNNNLLSAEKLSYLIDLDKRNPEAIKKLIKDSGIDPDDLDIDTEVSYKQNTYTVDDKELELDDTLSDIKDTETYAKTLDIISNKWDETSRGMLLQNPEAIRVINEHVQLGYYDKINAAVETERMFGRIPNSMSDLEAYRLVGDKINANGGFNQAPTKSTSITKRAVGKKKAVDPKVTQRKKAAGTTKSSPKGKPKENFNPLAMSDEEFEKLGMESFI